MAVDIVTKVFDDIINGLSTMLRNMLPSGSGLQESVPNYAFHLLIFLVNLIMTTPNLILFMLSDANVHIIFWLGAAPGYVNLSVPWFMILLNISFWFMTAMEANYKFVSWFIFVAFSVVGLLMFCTAVSVGVQTYIVMDSLWFSCGHDPLTAKIQKEWDILAEFQAKCIEEHGSKGYYIQQCPGFGQLRKGRETYVDYIEDVELDYGCQGFCTTWSRPLFDPETAGEACAVAIGSDVSNFGFWVAIPTMMTGQFTIWVGQCLARYKHI